jgi:hypothetical protein
MVQRKELGKEESRSKGKERIRSIDDILKDVDKKDRDTLLEELVLSTLHLRPRNVRDIVNYLKSNINGKLELDDDEIIYAIKRLEFKRILLYSRKVSFKEFMTDFYLGMTLWLVAMSTAATLLSIYILPESMPWSIVRIIAGGVFVLFVPGYALVQLLFPKKEMDLIERVAFSIGLSLAVVPLVGFLLNYSPWGIRLDPIVVSISLLSIVLAFASVYRKYMINKSIVEGNTDI